MEGRIVGRLWTAGAVLLAAIVLSGCNLGSPNRSFGGPSAASPGSPGGQATLGADTGVNPDATVADAGAAAATDGGQGPPTTDTTVVPGPDSPDTLPGPVAEGGEAGEVDTTTYRIQPGDILTINVFREASLNRNPRVDADGTVNLPMVKQVPVSGLTKYEAEQVLSAHYANGFLKNPIITVAVQAQGTSSEGSVRVLGEVRRPGLFPVPPGGSLSLLDTITAAGGFTDGANRGGIQITRIDEDGERQVVRANFDRIVDGKDEDVQLLPGDIVRVKLGWW